MAVDIEELRRQKERLEREREEVERRLAEAERREKEKVALEQLDALRDITRKIDGMKHERQLLLNRMRELAPRLGDFTFASDDYRMSLPAARASLKQPELFDRILRALDEAEIHVEPRAPRFRLFFKLHPVGTLQASARRLVIGITGPVLDPELLEAITALDSRFPGLAKVEYASKTSRRRVRETIPLRRPDGDFAESISFAAGDTGSVDAVLPLAIRALTHVGAWCDEGGPDEQPRWFEPIDSAPASTDAPASTSAPASTDAPMTTDAPVSTDASATSVPPASTPAATPAGSASPSPASATEVPAPTAPSVAESIDAAAESVKPTDPSAA